MKKNKLSEFFKGKGYYVLLFVGVLAIAAVAVLGSRISTNDNGGNDIVDLNEPNNNNIAAGDNNQLAKNNSPSDQVVNKGQANNQTGDDTSKQNVANNNSLLEFDVYTKEEENGIDLAEASSNAVEQEKETPAVETAGKTVKSEPAPSNLSFSDEDELLWPVQGNVIMNYSMDHTIPFATLNVWKCNPAIVIDAAEGTEVKSAAKGIITEIYEDDETGLTVKTDIGNGYNLVYGQLTDVTMKVGDKVNEGKVIGKIDKPTKYYSVEGSNLYFQMYKDGETVNPMSYLE